MSYNFRILYEMLIQVNMFYAVHYARSTVNCCSSLTYWFCSKREKARASYIFYYQKSKKLKLGVSIDAIYLVVYAICFKQINKYHADQTLEFFIENAITNEICVLITYLIN